MCQTVLLEEGNKNIQLREFKEMVHVMLVTQHTLLFRFTDVTVITQVVLSNYIQKQSVHNVIQITVG